MKCIPLLHLPQPSKLVGRGEKLSQSWIDQVPGAISSSVPMLEQPASFLLSPHLPSSAEHWLLEHAWQSP